MHQLQLTKEFKESVINALLAQRTQFTGADSLFAKQWGLNPAVYSRLKGGTQDGLIADSKLLEIAIRLGISPNERKWNHARTEVFAMIEEDIMFCKRYAKSRICVDESEIGKTFTAKYLSRKLQNCFYLDASQVEGKKIDFIRLLAQTIGIGPQGKIKDLLDMIKYYLKTLPEVIVIIDEAGDLEPATIKTLKGLWNGTENECAWYLIGADGLRSILEKGIRSKKPGFKETFSRFSSSYTTITPQGRDNQQIFYRKMIRQVLEVNNAPADTINTIVKKCLVQDANGQFGGLRRAEAMLILEAA
jgi:hypothetical protein